jgi:hypothetical protein
MNNHWGTRWRNRLGRQVLKPGVLGSIRTEDEPLTTTCKHYPNSIKTLIPKKKWQHSPRRVRQEWEILQSKKIEVKLTHLKIKKK